MDKFKDLFLTEAVMSDDDLFEAMVNFFLDFPEDLVPEDMHESFASILESLDIEEDDSETPDDPEDIGEGLEEAFKRKRIPPALKMKYRKIYRKNKSKIKAKLKRYRKSSAFKKWSRKSKRMGKMGKTASGTKKLDYV